MLERVRHERPALVWLSPPCGPYSPLQQVNQRSASQKKELEEKRKVAMRIYVSCACVFHECVQLGVHVAWEFGKVARVETATVAKAEV